MRSKVIFFLLITFNFSILGYSQKKIKVEETKYSFSTGKQNALKVPVYEAKPSEVEKIWSKKMKSFKAKVSKHGGEIFADNALIKDMSDNTMDIYAKVEDAGDNISYLYVAFNLGGAYLNSSDHSEMFKTAKKIMEKFSKEISKDVLSDKLKDQEKVLKSQVKEKESLEKKNKKLANDIENYKEKIKKAEKEIDENKKKKEEVEKKIEQQQKVVDELKAKLNKL